MDKKCDLKFLMLQEFACANEWSLNLINQIVIVHIEWKSTLPNIFDPGLPLILKTNMIWSTN